MTYALEQGDGGSRGSLERASDRDQVNSKEPVHASFPKEKTQIIWKQISKDAARQEQNTFSMLVGADCVFDRRVGRRH